MPSNMITSKFSYYVWKMYNLQIIEKPKKRLKTIKG